MREKWTEENEALTIYFELNRLVVGCYRCNTEGLTTPRYMNEHHDLCRRTGCTNVMTHIEIVKIISLFVAVCWLFCRCNRWLKVIFHFAFIAMAFVMSPLCKRQKKTTNSIGCVCECFFFIQSFISIRFICVMIALSAQMQLKTVSIRWTLVEIRNSRQNYLSCTFISFGVDTLA